MSEPDHLDVPWTTILWSIWPLLLFVSLFLVICSAAIFGVADMVWGFFQ